MEERKNLYPESLELMYANIEELYDDIRMSINSQCEVIIQQNYETVMRTSLSMRTKREKNEIYENKRMGTKAFVRCLSVLPPEVSDGRVRKSWLRCELLVHLFHYLRLGIHPKHYLDEEICDFHEGNVRREMGTSPMWSLKMTAPGFEGSFMFPKTFPRVNWSWKGSKVAVIARKSVTSF